MSRSKREKLPNSVDQADIVDAARAFVDALPEQDKIAGLITEGRDIAAIVESLGLTRDLVAAVHVYPLARDKIIDSTTLKNNELSSLSRLIIDLLQLGRFSLPRNWQPGQALAEQQSEALRKMLLAVVEDVRLVIVRIAEQLYRLRCARNQPKEQQQALAIETREIYAALANRLGVWQFKWELEDLSFRYLEPDTYRAIAHALNEKRVEREDFIEQIKATLKVELVKLDIKAEISGRPKHIYSIWRKMQRKDRGLDSLYDIRAVRILVSDVRECYTVLGAVHNRWSYLPGEFDDYIANPKGNNYQSLHTAVIGPEGKTVEIQIRSHDMHTQAELGVAAHWRYKEGRAAPAAFDQKIRVLRQMLEPTDDGVDLLAQIRDDVFEDHVYAISPKGEVVELPSNATPLDYAYHVHTQVGHRCRGAKVDGRIVPLSYKIQNGEQIEIITGSRSQPSRDWLSPKLGYIASARSRAKVRNWFRHQDKEQHQRQGREIFEREMARLNVRDVAADDVARQLKHQNAESVYVALGAGDMTSAAIATALQHMRGEEIPKALRVRRGSQRKTDKFDPTAISGVGDMLCNYARCCRPVPPEPIVGYITLGRGVSVHRQDCGNFLSLNQRHHERVLAINWGQSETAIYPVDLILRAYDRSGLLRDVSAVLADDKANVTGLQSHTDKNSMQTSMDISLEIVDLPTLSDVIGRLERLPNVISVKRRS